MFAMERGNKSDQQVEEEIGKNVGGLFRSFETVCSFRC